MATRGAANERMKTMEAVIGIRTLDLSEGLRNLHLVMSSQIPTCIAVVVVNWSRMLDGHSTPALLSNMQEEEKCASLANLPASLAVSSHVHESSRTIVSSPTEALNLSLNGVLTMVQRVVDQPVDADLSFVETGLDSLGAIELRNHFRYLFGPGVTVPSTLIFDHPTTRSVVGFLRCDEGREPAGAVGKVMSSDPEIKFANSAEQSDILKRALDEGALPKAITESHCSMVIQYRPKANSATPKRLEYFCLRGRAEIARLLLEVSGTPYDMVVHFWTTTTVMQYRTYAPCGQLPLYSGEELGSHGAYLSEEGAICRHIARITDQYGHSFEEQAKIDMLYELAKDIEHSRLESDVLALKKSLDAAARMLTSDGYFVGSEVTLAEVAIFRQLHEMLEIGHSPVLAYPKLVAFTHQLASTTKLNEYLSSERHLPLCRGDLHKLSFPHKYEFVTPPYALLKAKCWRPSHCSKPHAILGFHGGGSNREVFTYQCRSLQMAFAEQACWSFLQGTHKCSLFHDEHANAISPDSDKFSWYDVIYDGSSEDPGMSKLMDSSTRVTYTALEEELQRLELLLQPAERFDVFVAFSQGTIIATLLAARLSLEKRPRLLVLVSPIPPRDAAYAQKLFPHGRKIEVPCILLYGDPARDHHFPYRRTVMEFFAAPTLLSHEEGHAMPSKAADVKQLMQMMVDQLH